jgi:tripeptide aminopeptidase
MKKTTTTKAKADAAAVPKLNERQLVSLVMELMAVPGRSCEEAQIAALVQKKLLAAGAPKSAIQFDNAHQRTQRPGSVGNLILKLPGTLKGERRLLMAHLDTVPLCIGCKPVRKGKFVASANSKTGLGADDRAGVAVVLNAAMTILEEKLPHPPLTFLFVVQEEIGLHGARHLQTKLLGKPKLAFNWDGGPAEKITVGATGGYRMQIEITGLASHAGNAPEKGVSAIGIAGLAIADLVRNGWHGLIQKKEGVGTSNIGVIAGGDATNVVTNFVTVCAEARSHDPAFRKRIVKEIEFAFVRAASEVKSVHGEMGRVAFSGQLDYESFRLADDEPSVLTAEAAVRAAGGSPFRAIGNGGLDANWMTAHGIPTVTLGCGQMDVHTTAERLDVAQYLLAASIALRVALEP